ncbi:hypothetical protein BC835DRAFT_716469 [Cytidiella melzeri]|nr:hypothetical protein BC835DRAFT_716469 [Cytidiella melzeri]
MDMNATNITVSHLSPLISYVPGMLWSGGGKDPLVGYYQNKGYHSTNASEGEGRLYFSWVGTDVWVYGGYRERLGPYRIFLDGNQLSDYPGFQQGNPQNFDSVLFNSQGLKLGPHELEIVNISQDSFRPVLDINRIVYQHEISSATNITTGDPRCKWSTSNNTKSPLWTHTSGSMTTYSSLGAMNITFNESCCMGQ